MKGIKMCIYLEEYSVIINIVLILITGSLAFYTYRLYFTSQKSLKKQGDYYKATTRPFVDLIKDPEYCDVNRRENAIEVDYDFKNYGNTPAKDVQYKSEFFAGRDKKYKKDFEEEKRIYSIFPNKSLSNTTEILPVVFNNRDELYLHIAVTYKDIAENIHNTLNIFLISTETNTYLLELIYSHFD